MRGPRTRRGRWAWGPVAGFAAACLCSAAFTEGCSLLALDDLPYTPCEPVSGSCAALNPAGMEPSHCESWICVEGRCRQRRAVEPVEICDGNDQDCDGRIDEDGASAQTVSLSRLAEGDTLGLISSAPDDDVVVIADGRSADVRFTLATQAGGSWTRAEVTLSSTQPGDPCETSPCVVRDVVAARLDGAVLVAASAAESAATPARLRFGRFDAAVGPARVRLTDGAGAMGGVEPASGGSLDAIAMSLMPRRSGRTPQALVTYVARGSADVAEAVAVWLRADGTLVTSAPRELTTRPGAGGIGPGEAARPPAVIAVLPRDGVSAGSYLLAYPAAGGGLAVVTIDAPGEPDAGGSLAVRDERRLAPEVTVREIAIAADAEAARVLLAYTDDARLVLLEGIVDGTATWSAETSRLDAPDASALSAVWLASGLGVRERGVSGGGYLVAFRGAASTQVVRLPDGIPGPTVAAMPSAGEHPTGWQRGSGASLLLGVGEELVEVPHACGPRVDQDAP